jgi:hypothetical protein
MYKKKYDAQGRLECPVLNWLKKNGVMVNSDGLIRDAEGDDGADGSQRLGTDGTSSALCPMAKLHDSDVELTSSVTTVSVKGRHHNSFPTDTGEAAHNSLRQALMNTIMNIRAS